MRKGIAVLMMWRTAATANRTEVMPALMSQQFLQDRGATGALRRWGPTVAGLSIVPALPFILDHPVESGVGWLMNKIWPTEKGGTGVHDLAEQKQEL